MPDAHKTDSKTTTTTETHQEEHKSSLLTDILTVVGFAILFIIIIWGLVHLVGLIASSLSSNFAKPATTIQVSVPAQATSGQPLKVSWNYSPAVSGNYAFVYQCQKGLNFDLQGATSSKIAIPCGVAYTAGNSSSNSLTVIPTLTSTASATDTISIVFIPQASGSEAQGDASLVVNPAAKPVTNVTTKPASSKTSYSSGSSYSNTGTGYAGPADLAVSILSATINPNGYGTVTFNIANVGGSTSGNYTFSTQLPTAQPYPYNSPVQAPLAPGAHVVSTLNFTDARSGGGLFSVSINANDANTADNYASTQIAGPVNNNYSGYNNNSPYVQYPQYTY